MNIRYEVREGVAVATMDRPEKLNALTVDMRKAPGTAFEAAGVRPCGSLIGSDLKRLNDPSLKGLNRLRNRHPASHLFSQNAQHARVDG